jgi:serine/threonine-protein kinase
MFGGRYRILHPAGSGGMGIVFKAEDTALDQEVALKLIRPELAGVPLFLERFRREVRLTRQVTHPNVCRVHDIGEDDSGILFLSMEWIEGETLRRLLRQAGPLDVGRALEIAESIANALEAAHSKGIVHRDLKPENVMVDLRGNAFVMDFGIAVGLNARDLAGIQTGTGTPDYMAPEQVRGEPADARSDLFALGVILAELLTGAIPTDGSVASVQLPARTPRPVSALLTSLLELDRDRRCPSATRAVASLRDARRRHRLRGAISRSTWWIRAKRRPVAAVGAAAILLVTGVLAFREWSPPQPRPIPPIDKTSPGYGFYERASFYLDEAGSVRGLDDAIQHFNRALEADPDYAAAWAGLGEAYWYRFRLNGDASSKTNGARAVEKAFALSPDLPEAYAARGVAHFANSDFSSAKTDLARAVKLRPRFARAWAWLGTACRELSEYREGLQALRTAIRLKPQCFQHHYLLGNFLMRFSEHDEAAAAFRKAVEIRPDSSLAWNNLGAIYLHLQRFDKAEEAFRKSLESEPRARTFSNLGTASYYQGKYEEAIQSNRRATELGSAEPEVWGNLGDSLEMTGGAEQARGAYAEALRLARTRSDASPTDSYALAQLGLFYAKAKPAGWRERASDAGRRSLAMRPHDPELLLVSAVIAIELGREQEALDALAEAVRFGISRVQLEHEPSFRSLRRTEAFRKILELSS